MFGNMAVGDYPKLGGMHLWTYLFYRERPEEDLAQEAIQVLGINLGEVYIYLRCLLIPPISLLRQL